MRALTFSQIVALAFSATAQMTVRDTSPNGAVLWESSDLSHWQRGQAFSNSIQVATDAPQKFFKTEPRTAPAVLTILDTRQTIRGRSNKVVTNLTATAEGGTFKGWTEFRSYENGAMFCQWRFPAMPGCTNATVTAIDSDGFVTITNVTLNPSIPSDYIVPKPPRPARKASPGFAPASTVDAPGDYWVSGHQLTQVFTQTKFPTPTFDSWKESSITARAGMNDASVRFTRKEGVASNIHLDCFASYVSSNNWSMYLDDSGGSCWYQIYRSYADTLEASSYNDTSTWNPSEVARERLIHIGNAAVMLFVGNYNTGTNCTIRVKYNFVKMAERYETEITSWTPVAITNVTVGSTGALAGSYLTAQDDSYIDVTPQLNVAGDWLTFSVVFERWN